MRLYLGTVFQRKCRIFGENPNPMDKWKNRYRIPTARARFWDYGWNGSYFVTICTHRMIHYFGEVVNKQMVLNDAGRIAHDCLLLIPKYHPYTRLGEIVVMPNHIHAIVAICKEDDGRDDAPPVAEGKSHNQFGPQQGNLAAAIRGYTSGVTSRIWRSGIKDFDWQRRYWDNIIRTEQSYRNIHNYILTNPAKLDEDRFNDRRRRGIE